VIKRFFLVLAAVFLVSAPAPAYAVSASGYAYGYGTAYVALRRSIPPNWGDARLWLQHARADGYATGVNPAVGAIAYEADGIFAHVAYVEGVFDDSVVVSEMCFRGAWNRLTYRIVPADSFTYIY
jgi:surface antigen